MGTNTAHILAMYKDEYGKPRAWATGKAVNREEVIAYAHKMLCAYLKHKGMSPSKEYDYTLEVVTVD